MSDIREQLDEIFDQNMEDLSMYSEKAKVTAVDETAGTCTVQLAADDAEIIDVAFKTTKDNAEGIFITPTVDTYVMVSWLNNEVCFVSLVQDYDKVTIKKGGISIVLNGSDVTINAGSDTAVRASDIESKLNDLKAELDAHTHLGGSGGPVLAPPVASFTSFDKGDWEAPNVKL